MKTEKELRKEVDKILDDKVKAVIKTFETSRDESFTELVSLNQKLEEFEEKRTAALAEKSGLNLLRNGDLAKSNQLDIKLHWLEGQIRGYREQIDKVVTRLTELEVDPKSLNFFLNFKS